jgi:hypothetical protein
MPTRFAAACRGSMVPGLLLQMIPAGLDSRIMSYHHNMIVASPLRNIGRYVTLEAL